MQLHRRNAPQLLLPSTLAILLLSGCQATNGLSPREREIAAALRPILELDPDVIWTDAYNRLIELGPDSVAYLAELPLMTRRCAPDDLRVLLHTSLMRLLIARPGAPRLSLTCFETTLGVLHFDPKASGHRIGTVHRPPGPMPRRWHDLFPADFDHRVTPHIDADLDRLALQLWWRRHGDEAALQVAVAPLRPQLRWLWPVLSRRYADQWRYSPESAAVLCCQSWIVSRASPAQAATPTLIRAGSSNYDLVRAACVLLGRHSNPAVQDRLIELVGSRSDVVSYNARFSLGYAADPRIRALIQRHRPGAERERSKTESEDEPRVIKM